MGSCHDLSDVVSLDDSDFLYRRVHPAHVSDLRASCPPKQWKEGLSCDWSVLLASPSDTLRNQFPGHLLRVSVRQCRSIGLDVRYCPVVETSDRDYNLAHCLLVLPTDQTSKSAIDGVRERFLGLAQLIRVGRWYHRIYWAVQPLFQHAFGSKASGQ